MLRYLAIAALAAPISLAHASQAEVHHHDGMTEAVDSFYSHWMQPPSRQASCCNRIDCFPAETRLVNGRWEFRWIDRVHPLVNWVRVPNNYIENFQVDPHESPDGLAHLCLSTSGAPLCAVLGSGL
jgi:hypothetical protein